MSVSSVRRTATMRHELEIVIVIPHLLEMFDEARHNSLVVRGNDLSNQRRVGTLLSEFYTS